MVKEIMDIEIELTNKILDKQNLFWEEPLKIGYNTITWGDLVYAIIKSRSLLKASEVLNITNRTLERYIPKILSEKYGTKSSNSTPWKFILLADIDIRQCYKCAEYRILSTDFHSNGISNMKSECKYCVSKFTTEQDRVLNREKYKKYYNNNHGKELNRLKEVKLSRLLRVPKWRNKEKIEEIYNKCPEGYHVDHIIPLQGKLVSGLHVENNLQYLSAEDNWKKNNRYSGGED